ncbi:hypothetical protein AgCh_027375 [Apium graveolens]
MIHCGRTFRTAPTNHGWGRGPLKFIQKNCQLSISYHLPLTLAGNGTPLLLLKSSSNSLVYTHRALLLKLTSELALLLVARGESETLAVLLLGAGPDITLYMEEAELDLESRADKKCLAIWLIAMSIDFLEKFLPNPEPSGDEDLPDKLLQGAGSIKVDRTLGAPGLPLVAEVGRSESEVPKLGGTSLEKPGISTGFHGFGLTVEELGRGGAEFLVTLGAAFTTEGDFTEGADAFDDADRVFGLRVGVAALDVGFVAGAEGLVGVEDLALDLDVGVEDLAVDLAVGVEDLAVAVGVEDLAVAAGAEDLTAVGVEDFAVDLNVGVEDLAGTVGLVEGKVEQVGVEDLIGLEVMVTDGLDAIMDEGLEAEAGVGLRPRSK